MIGFQQKNGCRIMDMRFGRDNLIALATTEDGIPSVRAVNSYYEGGSFYVITHARSGKMHAITKNPHVGVCGDWFTGHGIAENMGHILNPDNADLADKLRAVFDQWYGNGHVNEGDPDTIILRIRLTDGILLDHGDRYDLTF